MYAQGVGTVLKFVDTCAVALCRVIQYQKIETTLIQSITIKTPNLMRILSYYAFSKWPT